MRADLLGADRSLTTSGENVNAESEEPPRCAWCESEAVGLALGPEVREGHERLMAAACGLCGPLVADRLRTLTPREALLGVVHSRTVEAP